jgi:hypothetical protein
MKKGQAKQKPSSREAPILTSEASSGEPAQVRKQVFILKFHSSSHSRSIFPNPLKPLTFNSISPPNEPRFFPSISQQSQSFHLPNNLIE